MPGSVPDLYPLEASSTPASLRVVTTKHLQALPHFSCRITPAKNHRSSFTAPGPYTGPAHSRGPKDCGSTNWSHALRPEMMQKETPAAQQPQHFRSRHLRPLSTITLPSAKFQELTPTSRPQEYLGRSLATLRNRGQDYWGGHSSPTSARFLHR